jgi:hypothetical protein
VLGPLNSGAYVDRRGAVTNFDCPMFDRPDERYTHPVAINNKGTVVGNCASGLFSFMRWKHGGVAQFSIPGADGMNTDDINDAGETVGGFYNPPLVGHSGWYRFKAFFRLADASHIVIDAPPHADHLGFPNSVTVTSVVGLNNHRRLIGSAVTIFTPSNVEGLKSNFVYSNGVFTALPAGRPISINNDDQVLMTDDRGGFSVFDDGYVFQINNPVGYRWNQIHSLNDVGQLTGQIIEDRVRTSPSDPPLASFQVLATPVSPAALASAR